MVLFSIGILLSSCSQTEIPPLPKSETNCPEAELPEQPRYEDLWNSSAHADAEAEAFIHWDEDDPKEIPENCAKCHSRPGFIDFLGVDDSVVGKVDKPAPVGTTITCYVCHNEATDDLASAIFPSGVKIRNLGPEARCIQCHQGRASTSTVNQAILELALDVDMPSEELGFINSHATSAATPFGSVVHGGYEYAGNTYRGMYVRGEEFFPCTRCHEQHSLKVKIDTCGECHTFSGTDPKDIRVDTTDFDGDGDVNEGIIYEIEVFQTVLLEAIQNYAAGTVGTPIAFDPNTHPYFFIDQNLDGAIDLDEALSENQFNPWTPRLLRAAYNYNYVIHDPGAYAHNSDYTLQILYDSIIDIGGDISQLTRP